MCPVRRPGVWRLVTEYGGKPWGQCEVAQVGNKGTDASRRAEEAGEVGVSTAQVLTAMWWDLRNDDLVERTTRSKNARVVAAAWQWHLAKVMTTLAVNNCANAQIGRNCCNALNSATSPLDPIGIGACCSCWFLYDTLARRFLSGGGRFDT
jgi:hypothetical protein